MSERFTAAIDFQPKKPFPSVKIGFEKVQFEELIPAFAGCNLCSQKCHLNITTFPPAQLTIILVSDLSRDLSD